MKRIVLKVSKTRINYTSAIRRRNDVISMILNIMSIIMQIDIQENYGCDLDEVEENDIGVILIIDRMSRIFLVSKNKIHSFQIPFGLKIVEDRYVFYSRGIDIDNLTLSLLNSVYYKLDEDYDFCALEDRFLNEVENYHIDKNSTSFVSSLVGILQTFEIGYLRYDYDDDPTRVNDITHPINHLDINFTNSATYKIGLNNRLDCKKLEDILDVNTKCAFIKDF